MKLLAADPIALNTKNEIFLAYVRTDLKKKKTRQSRWKHPVRICIRDWIARRKGSRKHNFRESRVCYSVSKRCVCALRTKDSRVIYRNAGPAINIHPAFVCSINELPATCKYAVISGIYNFFLFLFSFFFFFFFGQKALSGTLVGSFDDDGLIPTFSFSQQNRNYRRQKPLQRLSFRNKYLEISFFLPRTERTIYFLRLSPWNLLPEYPTAINATQSIAEDVYRWSILFYRTFASREESYCW